MTSTTKARKAVATPEPLPTHAQGLELFQAVKNALLLAGWTQLRVDTLLNPLSGPKRNAMTVRHHFDHGVWELYYEADRYWNPHGTPVRTAKIRTDRPGPLPSVEQIINELFGPEVGKYFPMTTTS